MNVSPKRRTEYIGIRVTREEKVIIQKAAKQFGTSVTELMVFSTMLTAKRLYETQRQLTKIAADFHNTLRGGEQHET